MGFSIPIDMRNELIPREFVTYVMNNMEPDAAIVSPWHQFTLLKYAQTVEGRRPDLFVLLHDYTHAEEISSLASKSDAFRSIITRGRLFLVDGRGIIPLSKPARNQGAVR